nr:hypothetical protein [Halomarina rubra]
MTWAKGEIREYPWRAPDASLYEVFVAEFFLTQTPADNVADVYPEFLDEFDSLATIDESHEDELVAAIEPLGFHNMRAEALKRIATNHDELPTEPERLRSLPRVGPYVANATLCFALKRRIPIVDRNVVRVYERVFGDAFPQSDSAREAFAEEMLPATGEEARTYNLALLDFGALVCHKRSPDCPVCFASGYCEYAVGLAEDQ